MISPREPLISRAWHVLRREGPAAAGIRTAAKLRDLVLRDNSAVWFARELTQLDLIERRQVPGGFSIVDPARLSEWLWDQNDLAWAADVRELEVAAQFGHRWACWESGGEIMAFCKIGGGRVFLVDFDRAVALPKGVAFLSEIHVLPHARRRSVGRELLISSMGFLAEQSFDVLSCHIPEVNLVSTRLFTSVGFRPYDRIRFTRVLGVSRFSAQPEDVLGSMAGTARRIL